MKLIAVGKSGQLTLAGAHMHDMWEIILNLEGSGIMTVGDEDFSFGEGDVVCVPPKVAHTKKADTFFVDTFVNLNGIGFEPDKIIRFHDTDGSVASIISIILSYYHREERNYRNIADKLASALEEIVIGKTETAPIRSRLTELIVATVIEHLSEPDFSVTEAMTSLGYCSDHARRIFAKDIGQTPLEYLTELRINHAKKLFCEHNRLHLTVTEVALASGYSDISYFSRIFKKHTGLSPRAYLENL